MSDKIKIHCDFETRSDMSFEEAIRGWKSYPRHHTVTLNPKKAEKSGIGYRTYIMADEAIMNVDLPQPTREQFKRVKRERDEQRRLRLAMFERFRKLQSKYDLLRNELRRLSDGK